MKKVYLTSQEWDRPIDARSAYEWPCGCEVRVYPSGGKVVESCEKHGSHYYAIRGQAIRQLVKEIGLNLREATHYIQVGGEK